MMQNTQAQQKSAFDEAECALMHQPLLQDYQRTDDLERQQMMNEANKPSQLQQLGCQNMRNDVVHDSDQKSINIHDSKNMTINQDDIKNQSNLAFGYGSNPLANQSCFSTDLQSQSNMKFQENIAGSQGPSSIPVREIDLSKHINIKRNTRLDMNEGIGHDRQLNLNPEETQDMFRDSQFSTSTSNKDSNLTQPISQQQTQSIFSGRQGNTQQSSIDQKLNLKDQQDQNQLQVQKLTSETEPPRGTFGGTVDWKDLQFNDQQHKFQAPNLQQQKQTQLDLEEQRRFPAQQQQQQEQFNQDISNIDVNAKKSKILNTQDIDQGEELRKLDISNQPPIEDANQIDFTKKQNLDTEWKLIDKIKFAMYNKIYKMFADEQRDLKEDDEFDQEIESEETKDRSSFDEQQPILQRKKSNRGQELMRRFQTCIKKKLKEMQKRDRSQGIIFKEDEQQQQQQTLPRRRLSRDQETHQRSKSPERILDTHSKMIKNKDRIIETKQQTRDIKPIHRKKLEQQDIGKTLISQTQPQVKSNKSKKQQSQLMQQSKKRTSSQFEADSNYDQIGRWRFQKDRSQIDDGFQEGDLECLFDESKFWADYDKVQKQRALKQDQIKQRLSQRSQKKLTSNQDQENYGQIGRWRFQKDRSKIDDGFQQGDLECLFYDSEFRNTTNKQQSQQPKRRQIKQKKDEDNYAVINGWRFQKDRSGINDGFEQGDLENLFDETKKWKGHKRQQKTQKKQEPTIWTNFKFDKDIYDQYDIINGWKFQRDRSHIDDGFREGDLPHLFNEAPFWNSMKKPQDDNYDQIGRWRFQKDRSQIDDSFQEGDLACLFDDSQFWKDIESEKQKKQIKPKISKKDITQLDWQTVGGDQYDEINGWKFQKDRSHIFDGFEQGDLPRLFDERRFWRSMKPRKYQLKRKQKLARREATRALNLPKPKEEDYDVINGWRFQKDRSSIFDGFEEGDLPRLFDESQVVDFIPKHGMTKKQIAFRKEHPQIQRKPQPRKEKPIDKNYNVVNGWRYQIDRSNIFDGFEAGDLERLFDETQVQDKIPSKSEIKEKKAKDEYNTINGWRYQVDRSNIFDGFEEGDLARLFDESQVVDRIPTKKELKEQQEKRDYNVINGWRYQVDRSKIFDGFDQGDLPRLFDESKVMKRIPTKQELKERQMKKDYKTTNGWTFQVDRSRIDDGFEAGDLSSLFDDSNFASGSTEMSFDVDVPPNLKLEKSIPNELDYKEQLQALQRKNRLRKSKRSRKQKLSDQELETERSQKRWDIFGDPYNLLHKTMCTSEDHLIIQPGVKLDKVFPKGDLAMQRKPTQEERQQQSQRDKEQAKRRKLEQEQLEKQREQEKLALKMQSQAQKAQAMQPKLTLNQKKKIKRKERKARQSLMAHHDELWASLDEQQIFSPIDQNESFDRQHFAQAVHQ